MTFCLAGQRSSEPSLRLASAVARRGVVADVFVVGGAAMALAYDAARVTRDVDAVFKPHGIVLEEARNPGRSGSMRAVRRSTAASLRHAVGAPRGPLCHGGALAGHA